MLAGQGFIRYFQALMESHGTSSGIFKHLWNPMELLPKPGVAGSIPAGGTISLVFQELFASLFVTDCD